MGCLRAMLRRICAEFVEREQIDKGSADALCRERTLDPDRELFYARLRDMHGLWHVATGYNRDLLGEAALLSFSHARPATVGVGFIVAVASMRPAKGDLRTRGRC